MANNKLKRAARARQKQTGERYTEALARVREELAMSKNNEEHKLQAVVDWLTPRFRVHLDEDEDELIFYEPGTGKVQRVKKDGPQAYILDLEPPEGEGMRRMAWSASQVLPLLEAHFGPSPEDAPSVEEGLRARLSSREEDLRRKEQQVLTLRARLMEYGEEEPDPWGRYLEQSKKRQLFSSGIPAWSTFRFCAGGSFSYSKNALFLAPLGLPGQGFERPLTLAETNLRKSGLGSLGLDVYAQVLHVELIGGTEADRKRIKQYGVLRWMVTQTSIDIAPLSAVCSPGEDSGAMLLAPLPGQDLQTEEDGETILFRFGGPQGVRLPAGNPYAVQLELSGECGTMESDVSVRVALGCLVAETKAVEIA